MSHDHIVGWIRCQQCGITAPLDCPVCTEIHVKLHHHKRRFRRKPEVEA